MNNAKIKENEKKNSHTKTIINNIKLILDLLFKDKPISIDVKDENTGETKETIEIYIPKENTKQGKQRYVVVYGDGWIAPTAHSLEPR